MFMERAQSATARAERELAARRAALDEAMAAAARGEADIDPIDLIDHALAVQAAEAVASARAICVRYPDAG